MNILVTGGAGYLGTELVRRLAATQGVGSISIYDNLSRGCRAIFIGPNPNPDCQVKFIQADILDSRSLKRAISQSDVVFHLAAHVSTPHAHLDTHIYEQVNHWGTAEVVSAFENSDAECLFYISSTSVYGNSTEPATVHFPTNPRTSYCKSKLRAEQQVARLMAHRRVVTVRLANMYGYSDAMRFDAVVNKFAFQAHFGKKISIHGSGKQTRAFIHVDDAAEMLAQLAISNVKSGVYNLGTGNYSVLELTDGLKSAIPHLEFNFVDQHFELYSFLMEIDLELDNWCHIPKARDIDSELASLVEHFSF